MGTIIKNIFPCFHKEKGNTNNENNNNISTNSFKEFINISKGEFYCPDCSKVSNEIPEIVEVLKIHSDSGKIDILCPKRQKVKPLTMEEYVKELKENNINKCGKEDCINRNGEQKEVEYCTKCRQILCGDCSLKDSIKPKCQIISQNCYCCLNGEQNEKLHFHIKQKEFGSICLNHKLKTDECCKECERYVCKICLKEFHQRHNKGKIREIDIQKAKKIILKKDEQLEKMKQFYKMVQKSYEKNNQNNIYKNNVINVAKCISREEKRNNCDIELALYKLRKMEKQNGNEIQVINNI